MIYHLTSADDLNNLTPGVIFEDAEGTIGQASDSRYSSGGRVFYVVGNEQDHRSEDFTLPATILYTPTSQLLAAVEAVQSEIEEMRMTAHGTLDQAVRRDMSLAADALEAAINDALEGE